jgi:hypothetical protein
MLKRHNQRSLGLSLASAMVFLIIGSSEVDAQTAYEKCLKELTQKRLQKAQSLADLSVQDPKISRPQQRALIRLSLILKANTLFNNNLARADELEAMQKALKSIESKVGFEDVPFLSPLPPLLPLSVKASATGWLRRARESGLEVKSINSYIKLMRIRDKETRQNGTAAIARQLARKRSLVLAGGNLSSADQRMFTSRPMIDKLVDQLNQEEDLPDLDQMSATKTALHTLNARAIHALIIIETPALPNLRALAQAGNERAALCIILIEKAAKQRLRRFPKSSWSSAKGLIPTAGILRGYCQFCKVSMPVAALHCSRCGKSLEKSVTSRCEKCALPLSKAGLCQRCGGGRSAVKEKEETCRVCRLAVKNSAPYCIHCGQAQRMLPPADSNRGRKDGAKGKKKQ